MIPFNPISAAPSNQKNRTLSRSLVAAFVLTAIFSALPAGAVAPTASVFTVTIQQVGPDVVFTGSGNIDTTGLTFSAIASSSTPVPQASPFGGTCVLGTGSAELASASIGGPFGGFGSSSTLNYASSATGDYVGITPGTFDVYVPSGYVSDSPLSDSATYSGQTLTSLGITPGTHTFTFGTNSDKFVIAATSSVPEPASLSLLAIGATALLGRRRSGGAF